MPFMKIESIDHFVITSKNFDKCKHFYIDILGMRYETDGRRHAFLFGDQKINVHLAKGEFQPSAKNPGYGTQDFCLVSKGNPEEIKRELADAGIKIVDGVVQRNGARGNMQSVYVYDPDGNLVEIAVYE